MLDFETARQNILRACTPLAAEEVGLLEAEGRVLAADLVSGLDLPAFDYSAMDGYAVRVADFTLGAEAWELPVAFEQRAGSAPKSLEAGSVARIFTGAPLPAFADAVIMQEDTERRGDLARFSSSPKVGDNVRRRGSDLAQGAVALARGTRLNPYGLGLVAALDRNRVLVTQQPRVELLCTGDELRDPGSPDRPGSIPDSNGPSLAALVRKSGARVTQVRRTSDDFEATRRAVRSALANADVLLTVGGVSVGDHDVVKAALEAEGVTLDFWKVSIKPGKPLAFGRHGPRFVLGLPGNPVSAQLTLSLFGLPLLRALEGDARPLPTPVTVRLASAVRQKPGRLGFYRARLEGDVAHVLHNQSSGAPNSMAMADALVMIDAASSGLEAGATASALRLSDL